MAAHFACAVTTGSLDQTAGPASYEMVRWFDKYVKNAPPRASAGAATIGMETPPAAPSPWAGGATATTILA